MVSKQFNNREEARAWAVEQNIRTKRFAATNDMWGFNIITLDLLFPNTLCARSVYAEERMDVEQSYSKIMSTIKEYNIPYYVTNNFDFNRGSEYNKLLESMKF